MQNPLVTLVVPCFNAQDKIESALQTIQNQSYKNIEVIFVNDASTDATDATLTKLSKKYTFLYIKNKSNRGVHETVNVGFEHAHGEWLTNLDVDDELPRDAIATRLAIALQTGVDTVITAEKVVYKGRTKIVKPPTTNQELHRFLISKNRGDVGVNSHAYLTRKSLVKKITGRPIYTHRYHSDYSFILELMTNGTWHSSQEITYLYLRGDGLLKQEMTDSVWYDTLQEIESNYAKIIKNNL